MTKNNLFQESIADAKALKEIASENAKQMLAESFSDKLEEMVNKLLKEESDFDDKSFDKKDTSKKDTSKKDTSKKDTSKKDMDETSYMKDGEKGIPARGDIEEPPFDEKDKKKESKKESVESELDAFLESVDEELSKVRESSHEDDKKEDEKDDMEDDDEMDEVVDTSNIGKGDNVKPSTKADRANTEDPQGKKGHNFEGVSREDFMRAVMEAVEEALAETKELTGDTGSDDGMGGSKAPESKKNFKSGEIKEMADKISALESQVTDSNNKLSETEDKLKEAVEELEEAKNVIGRLTSTINEANLLNSKLLYVNKLNNEFDLTEVQKEKILTKINEGENIKEVKLIYSVLKESFEGGSIKKKQISENTTKSVASEVVGSTAPSKTTINENGVFPNVQRFQELAGIRKPNILED